MTKRDQIKIRQLVRDGRVAVVMQKIRFECWDCKYGMLIGGDCTGRGYMESPCVLGGAKGMKNE